MTDDRLSDETTGLPPLEEIGEDPAILVLLWATGDGIAAGKSKSTVACRFLHIRGLATKDDTTKWAQIHLAIPSEAIPSLVEALTKDWHGDL